MIYLLDTDILIFFIRGSKLTTPKNERERNLSSKAQLILAKWRYRKARGDTIALSSVSVAELEYGAHRAENYDREISAVAKILSPFTILDFDRTCALEYGTIRFQLETAGIPIGAMDLLIAAHAQATGSTLVTNNHNCNHFNRIPGLHIESW
ncbi:MAG TPA: type II toxin-antitoxin system VapC family toxin [Verrucomicrobiae bacterium]